MTEIGTANADAPSQGGSGWWRPAALAAAAGAGHRPRRFGSAAGAAQEDEHEAVRPPSLLAQFTAPAIRSDRRVSSACATPSVRVRKSACSHRHQLATRREQQRGNDAVLHLFQFGGIE